uniref:Tetratricopeptide repeat protein n=1 Tax=Desulfacinum infernum TaxID=35837 RepID=A0A831ZKL5_9BACT
MKRHGRTGRKHVGSHGALWKLWHVGAVLLVLGMASCVPQPSPEGDPTAWMSADELRALGDKFLAAGDTGQALQYLVAAEKKDAKDPRIHYSLALAYAARRLPDRALEHFQKALQLKPDYSEAHNALGVFYAEQGKTDQAAEHFQKALANPFYRTPEKPLFNLGRIMADQGRYAEALRYFDEALHFKETYAEAHLYRGRALEALGRQAEARRAFKAAVAHGPNLPDAQFHYGRSCAAEGRSEEAVSAFRQVMRLAPGTPLADAASVYLRKMGIEGLSQ